MSIRPHGFPITIAIAAARNGNGTDTAARNQTNLAGMNGISHKIMPLEGEQRPGDDIGDHLRRAAADFQRHRADRKADHRAARRRRAGDHGSQHAEPAADPARASR